MQWSELYRKEQEPSEHQIKEFVDSPLWDNLAHYLQQSYNTMPKLCYSDCSMDSGSWKGWNIKYKKSGKALCSLYPKPGYFIALIAVGAKEIVEADSLIQYTQNVYHQTKFGYAGKSLALDVKSEQILQDVKNLIALRTAPRTM